MGFLKMTLWSFFCVGLGIFLASFDVSGKTPIQHAEAAWKSESPKAMTQLKSGFQSAVERVRSDEKMPSEDYAATDRDAVNQLVKQSEKVSRK